MLQRRMTNTTARVVQVLATMGLCFGLMAVVIWGYDLFRNGFRAEIAVFLAFNLSGILVCVLLLWFAKVPKSN